MNQWTPEQVSSLLSAYVDGALEAEKAKEVEAFLLSHPDAAKELQELRRMKHLLAAKKPAVPNPYFWTRLFAEMESRKKEEGNLLPFPQKYVPAAAVLGTVAVLAVGVAVFQQRGPLLDYFSRTSQRVQEVYEAGLLRGSILPLFNNVGKDQVLQFALFGTLPLDAKAETALRVDEGSEQGYRIDVGLTADQKPPTVTVEEFMKHVRPTVAEAVMIDSVLEDARQQIESAAFYGENNALAIDPELTRLNKVVISNIAAVLAPVPRKRFDRFLHERNATYSVTAAQMRAPMAKEPRLREFPRTHRRDYIVVTAESLTLAPLNIDFEHMIEENEAVHVTPPEFHRRFEKLMSPRVKPRVVVQAPGMRERIRIIGDQDFFQIQIQPGVPEFKEESLGVWVAPRQQRSRVFKFEYRMPEGNVQVFEMTPIEEDIRMEMDSMKRRLMDEGGGHERVMRQFDSLWNTATPGFIRPRMPRKKIQVDSTNRNEESSVRRRRLEEDSSSPKMWVPPQKPDPGLKPKKKTAKSIDT